MENELSELKEDLKALRIKVNRASRTDWGLLASWAGVLLTLVGSIGYMAINPVESEVDRLRAWKKKAVNQVLIITEQNAIYRERIRSLERTVYQESKDI